MVEPELILHFDSEAALVAAGGAFARGLESVRPLVMGLEGGLGTGKTTWVRAMLRGLGYAGRVPSPTYTLLEHYALPSLAVVHLDLYRLAGDAEFENLGLRDWLAERDCWIVLEWPDKAPALRARCDLVLTFEEQGANGRAVRARPATSAGNEALRALRQATSNNTL
jgi:tRNA threonylcarbamoyladenosine biosynthesis protein TsaE